MSRNPKRKAAKTSAAQLQSPTARLKLAAQARAYFVKIADGAWLGYRKPSSGLASWVVRSGGSDGKGWERTMWRADDASLKADGAKVLNFWQARTEALKLASKKSRADTATAGNDGAPVTLAMAMEMHEADLLRRGSNVYNASRARCHLTEAQLSKPVTLFTEDELTLWRDGLLKKGLAPSSVNRTISTVRTALTLADKSRAHIWRSGLKALPDATEANNVVIEDEAKAQQWVAASSHDHQLGLLTHVIAESGARPSQGVRLRIRDLITRDPAAPRLMMPKSGKGGTRSPGHRKLERYSVSISPELAALLKAAAKGRPSNAPLLVRQNGQAWDEGNPNPYDRYKEALKIILPSIGLDPTIYGMYAFRHTSITRMLLQGTPTSIVAKAHDTSEAEIRKHYAASILDFSDEITRKTLPSFGPALVPASNVVKLGKR